MIDESVKSTHHSTDHLDKAYGKRMEESVSHFLDNSKVKSNGIREVSKASYMDALGKHGVSADDIKRVQEAVDFENTAAARVALHDLENIIKSSTKDELKDETFRKNLEATVRLPTHGGSTEVTVQAERFSNVPFRGEGEAPERRASYGRLSTSINTKQRIHKDFHEEASERMRKALGIKD